jgi:hypothetical protein
MLEQDFGTSLEGEVYQMNLASKSLFGDKVGDGHTFENYHKYLKSNGKSIDYVVTRISFNEENDNQSVLFNAARFINKSEYEKLQDVSGLETTKALVTMGFSASATKQLAAPEPEPIKRPAKRTEEPTTKQSLADVVSAWGEKE